MISRGSSAQHAIQLPGTTCCKQDTAPVVQACAHLAVHHELRDLRVAAVLRRELAVVKIRAALVARVVREATGVVLGPLVSDYNSPSRIPLYLFSRLGSSRSARWRLARDERNTTPRIG